MVYVEYTQCTWCIIVYVVLINVRDICLIYEVCVQYIMCCMFGIRGVY